MAQLQIIEDITLHGKVWRLSIKVEGFYNVVIYVSMDGDSRKGYIRETPSSKVTV
ncbi:hypothetical protein H5410_039733 [Solanum commersonii]|uniref:Uncharacterized protein n=1 Tax=Solanum commersonii TaxID=4109 RepID=A0A9J5XLT4_SOLCO|nr:hypothetical protein H5410_039733 [Solanum commersonii]